MKSISTVALSALVLMVLGGCNRAESPAEVSKDVSSAQSEAASDVNEARSDAASDVADAQGSVNSEVNDAAKTAAMAAYDVEVA